MGRSDIGRVIAARFISRTGGEAAFFVGVWGIAAFRLHADAGQLALVMLAMSAGQLLGGLAGGVLVDRYGPKRVLVLGELAFVPATLAVTLATDIPQLIVLTAGWSFMSAPVYSAMASFAPYLVGGEKDLERVNARIGVAGSLAFVAGAAGGAALAGFLSVDWVFYADAATSIVAAALVLGVALRTSPAPRAPGSGAFRELREGLAAAYGSRPLRYYVLAGTIVWLGFGAFGALEPLFFRDVLGTGVEAIGWVNALFGIGLVLGAALLPRLPDRVLSARGLALFVVLTGIGDILYIAWRDVRLVAVGGFVWAVAVGVLDPLLRTLIHRDTPHGLVGRVMGTAEVHRTVGEIAPLAFAPALAAALGVQVTLAIGGALTALLGAISLLEARRVDALTRGARKVALAGLEPTAEPVSPNP